MGSSDHIPENKRINNPDDCLDLGQLADTQHGNSNSTGNRRLADAGQQMMDDLVDHQVVKRDDIQSNGEPLSFGNYVLLEKIGEGGMGMVLKARHSRMDRVVALKILSSRLLESPDRVERFQREVRAAARLEHPNIVSAYDADEARGTHFLVMQYVEGSDLWKLVRRTGQMTIDLALECILQTARGLE